MASYQDHIDNMTADAVVSANKALDYLDGDQVKWLEELLDCAQGGIKKWRERGVYPWCTNLTKKIVTRSAMSYNEAPVRVVENAAGGDEAATEIYLDLLDGGEFDNVMDAADSVARLLKNVIVLAQAVDVVGEGEKILFSVLHRGNCDVDYDHQNGVIRSLIYQSAGTSTNGGKLYHYWDAETVKDIEDGDNGLRVLATENHGYKMIPAAILWDNSKPRAGFWPKAAWEELVRLNEGVNLFHTEVKFNERFQAFGALFTNGTIPEGSVIGPDGIVELSGQAGEAIFLEYRTPTINLATFADWLEDFIAGVADNWGVNLSTGGTGSAESGFKLVVEEVWNLETRQGRIKSAVSFEKQMYKVIKAISDARGYKLPADSWIEVDFPEPSLPVNRIEDWTIKKEKVALGYSPLEDEWRKDNPEITDQQINERKTALGVGGIVPTFGGSVDE